MIARYLFIICILWGCISSSFAQNGQLISIGEEITGTLSPSSQNASYTIRTIQRFVEVIVSVDSRDFTMSLELRDANDTLVIDRNEQLNYPHFQGLYLFSDIGDPGTYRIELHADIETGTLPYTLLVREHAGDEPPRAMSLFQSLDGWIGPVPENDSYILNLRRGSPVMFTIVTPMNILDSFVGIIDPNGDAVAVNRDFFGTRSVLVFNPEITGEHIVVVGGDYQDSEGPYTIIANPVASFSPPFTTDDELIIPGEVLAYQIPLKENQTYDFSAVGVDEFAPTLVLTDASQEAIAVDSVTEELTLTSIPGFTPLFDDSLYLFVLGTDNQAGTFNLTVDINPDEEDGIELSDSQPFASEIGPVGDVDEYIFNAEANVHYSIRVTPTWHYLDPQVGVYDSDGNRIFFNDDSAEGSYSLLSNIVFPEAGEYRIRVEASSQQENKLRQSGVYIVDIARGTPYDVVPPRIFEIDASTEAIASGVRVLLPSTAIFDDTYPLQVQLINDRTGEPYDFAIDSEQDYAVEVPGQPDDIFQITATDSSDGNYSSDPIFIPGPQDVALLEGVSFPMAIDQENNIYVIDTDIGSVVRYSVDGATQEIAILAPTQGGILGPNSIAIDSEGVLFISNGLDHSITKVSPNGFKTYFKSPNTGLNIPVDLAFDAEGILYVAQTGPDNIVRIMPGDRIEVVAGGVRNPNNIAFGPDGTLYAVNSDRGNSGIYRVEADGTMTAFAAPFAQTLEGMAFDSEGYLYAADGIAGVVYRVDPQGNVVRFTRGLSGNADLAFGYGEYEKTLFATNMGIEADGYFARYLIAIPTGRTGLPLPFSTSTGIGDWNLF